MDRPVNRFRSLRLAERQNSISSRFSSCTIVARFLWFSVHPSPWAKMRVLLTPVFLCPFFSPGSSSSGLEYLQVLNRVQYSDVFFGP